MGLSDVGAALAAHVKGVRESLRSEPGQGRRPHYPDQGLVEHLDASLEPLGVDFSDGAISLAQAKLEIVGRRNSPVRRLSAAPIHGTARMGFADGTTVIVRAPHPGDLGWVAIQVARRVRVQLSGLERGPGGLFITLRIGSRRLIMEVLGPDQSD